MWFKARFTGPLIRLLLMPFLLGFAPLTLAGKYSYPEFLPVLTRGAVQILQKHGMPVRLDRENPWLYVSGILGDYTLKFHKSDDIPRQAILDVIELCMDAYEKRGQKEAFRIVMYRETHKEWRESLFLGIGALTSMEPVVEFTIGREGR